MQKSKKKLYSVLGIGLLSILLTTGILLVKKQPQKAEEQEVMKVGMVLYQEKDVFISNTWMGMQHYMEKLIQDTGIQLHIEMVDSKHNQELQNQQIDHFIQEGYDVIVANTVEREVAGTIIDKVQRANIPIIFFNREPVPEDMGKWEHVYYVGSRAEEAGKMQGQILADAMEAGLDVDKNGDGKIQYVMIEGEYGHQDAILRTYYCIKELEDRGFEMDNLATDTGQWRREQGKEKMTEWLALYGEEIEVVMANNDEMALGAIEALEEKGYFQNGKTMPVVGVDGIGEALEAIEQGKMMGTVLNNSDEQAKCIVAKIYEILSGNGDYFTLQTQEENHYFWVNHQKITRENIHTVKNVP